MEIKCPKCGGNVFFDGEDETDKVDDDVVLQGDAWCVECEAKFRYDIRYYVDFKNPNSVWLSDKRKGRYLTGDEQLKDYIILDFKKID